MATSDAPQSVLLDETPHHSLFCRLGASRLRSLKHGPPQTATPLLTAAFPGDPARVDDLIVLSENAADRGGMDLEQAGRPRTRSLTLVTLRHLSSYCAQLSSWASPMRSPSGPRMWQSRYASLYWTTSPTSCAPRVRSLSSVSSMSSTANMTRR